MDGKGIISEDMLDEVILDYLREDGTLPPPDPGGVVSAVIVRARRVEFTEAPGQKPRLAFPGPEAGDEELKLLNDSSWTLLADLPDARPYTHLIRSGPDLWTASVLWL
jgi:hypothetical protein